MSSTEGVCCYDKEGAARAGLFPVDVKNDKYVLYLSSECVGGMVNSRIVALYISLESNNSRIHHTTNTFTTQIQDILTILDIIYIVQYLKVNHYLLRIMVLQCS